MTHGQEHKQYVLGFLFSSDRESVLLMWKKRPAFQCGRLNGIGGKIEPGESPLDAMERETEEEIGVSGIEWVQRGNMHGCNDDGQTFVCFVFSAHTSKIRKARTRTDEQVRVGSCAHVLRNPSAFPLMENIPWLVAFCRSTDYRATFSVEYTPASHEIGGV